MRSLFLLSALVLPEQAFAYVGVDAADAVGAGMLQIGGGFGGIAATIGEIFYFFINAAAILTIVITGMVAVVAQDEGRIAKSRKTVVMALIGIVMVNIAYALQQGYLTAFDFDNGANPAGGAAIVSDEVYGFINFMESIVGILAVLTIIIYGVKAVVDYGGENGIQAFRKAVVAVMLGIGILAAKFLIAGSVLTGDPSGIITPAVRTLMDIVAFAALVAVVVIVVAGIIMVISVGKEDQYTRAKNIVMRTLIGLMVLVVATALLILVINGVT